ncbi:unnamed protein product [Tilletia controversa]|uniref:Uncharacterized protein n=1 Tax=Tilletia controversa TaxID=13291 RepID=A0A8X7MP60_9BASI|nr:hypothetical protein CF328_g5388 [Tilletia controversa]KAE8192546.1 hypothetical protein CF336_g4387 [Tilletia laevis]KAE8243383.1 hypothetical protein A4X06_0g6357 [Tilletia controversa]CAD6938760.1 unnamed protein product [Tilletia controversa]CAD6938778.1 unnamed protein product [Tilletia controversa]
MLQNLQDEYKAHMYQWMELDNAKAMLRERERQSFEDRERQHMEELVENARKAQAAKADASAALRYLRRCLIFFKPLVLTPQHT